MPQPGATRTASEEDEDKQKKPDTEEGSAFEKLSDGAKTAIVSLVRGCLKEETSARRTEVRNAWKQRSFKNGIQHLWYDKRSYCYSLPEASGETLPAYMDVYNIYTPHRRSFVSILSQNPPGINFDPDDLKVSRDITAASYAEKMRHRVDRLVHMKDKQGSAAGYLCTDGRVVSRTWIDNDKKLRCEMYGVLEAKVPIFARSMKKWPYCIISAEEDLDGAKDDYPDDADEIDAGDNGTAEASYERLARLGILANKRGSTGYGETLKNLVTHHEAWLRPSRYRKADKDAKKELKAAFPDGFRATVIGEVCCDCVAETIESTLACEWAIDGEGSSRPSLLHDLVPIQEAYNDIKNQLRENADYGIPATWFDLRAVDSEAVPEQRSEPGAMHGVTPPPGMSVKDCVFQEQPTQLSPETVAMLDALLKDGEFTTGDFPAQYGGDTPGQDTVGVNKLLNNQAKGQLSFAWGSIQWLFAKIYTVACKLAAQTAADGQDMAIQSGKGQEQFNPGAILDGNWGAFPDTDSSFPQTTADKRAALAAMTADLSAGGEAGLAILTQPDNMKLRAQLGGLSEFIIPGAEARDKQLWEIEQLLLEVPVPDMDPQKQQQWQQAVEQAQAQRQPPPPEPTTASIPVGKRDYHQDELNKIQEWLSSTAYREQMQKGNQKGVENVELHADLHEAAIAAGQPKPQTKPPNVTLTAAITDPAAIAQLLGEVGAQTTPDAIDAANLPDAQNTAADTQNKAASAQHKAVLAAKEAAAPASNFGTRPQAPPVKK
jgi:hypothetical protein